MRRKIIPSVIIPVLSILLSTFHSTAQSFDPAYIVIDDFQKYEHNPFSDWKFKKEYYKAAAVYSIAEENGRKFLRAVCDKTSSMVLLGKRINNPKARGESRVKWDIYRYPFISWEWRVKKIPEGANEDDDDMNDSAASIYVVFQKTKLPLSDWQNQPANWIKYVWSSTLPTGTVVTKKFSKLGVTLYEGKYIVVASGEKDTGKWTSFKRNVLDDYRRCFGSEPSFHPGVIGILTDANTTHTEAEADYDNIMVLQNQG